MQKASLSANPNILLIISGGIAAYKSLLLTRMFVENGLDAKVVMTANATKFIQPLSFEALSGNKVHTELFSCDMSAAKHIALARDSDLVVVAPATSRIIAAMACGMADDLATNILLATEAPILVAPAMNYRMWNHVNVQRNVTTLCSNGVQFIGPNTGSMAEHGEWGAGRMAEPLDILERAKAILESINHNKPLAGKKILVTSGATQEPLDPVRYIANRSSGRQGHAIAAAAVKLGADVTLISGPVSIPDPVGALVVHVNTALEMLEAVRLCLPVDVAIMAAAVSDWYSPDIAPHKIKKTTNNMDFSVRLKPTPDILAFVGRHPSLRPKFVVGFAAETSNIIQNAQTKLLKGADLIVANDVNAITENMGGTHNTITIISNNNTIEWPRLAKTAVADKLLFHIAQLINNLINQ